MQLYVHIYIYIYIYIPDKYKTKKMCNKGILENGGTLKSVSNQYKTQEMCDKVVNNYVNAL